MLVFVHTYMHTYMGVLVRLHTYMGVGCVCTPCVFTSPHLSLVLLTKPRFLCFQVAAVAAVPCPYELNLLPTP